MNILRNFSRCESAVEFIGGMVAFSLKLGDAENFISVKVKIFSGILRRRFGGETIDKEILIKIGKMKLDIDAIKNGTTEMFGVVVNLSGGAGAGLDMRSVVTTRAGVHGRKKCEIGGKSSTFFGAGNRNLVVFERLTNSLKYRAGKFG